jgi:DNA-directed RNA polymerase sigma subunit (sigma70/sigma32)
MDVSRDGAPSLLEMTRERQIEAEALRRLRDLEVAQHLREYLEKKTKMAG